MFESLTPAPADPILGLTEAFKKDPNPKKINLGVGVYKDGGGTTPTLACVREAERKILEADEPKTYLPIPGDAIYDSLVQPLLFGEGSEVVTSGRAGTAQTPGGTGALRVAGEFCRRALGKERIWVSDPTWANHHKVFTAAGLEVKSYRYYDPSRNGLDFEGMKEDLSRLGPDDVVLLHGCCHNPTGVDPTPAQWKEIVALRDERSFLAFVDLAYQGFDRGVEEDATAVRALAAPGRELLVASSFSKNFGLYNERVGAFTLVARDTEAAQVAFSRVKSLIRGNYSNPPHHGAAIVRTVLGDETLRAKWIEELAGMRKRIHTMREALVKGLAAAGVSKDFGFITDQNGMFSYSGLTKDQVETLREKHSVYVVGSGRINDAGITESNLLHLCEAIKDVVG